MAVTEQDPITTILANGVTTVFPFAFTALQATDLVVMGGVTVKALGVDYTVALGPTSGSVTFLVPPANGTLVTIYRDTKLTRSTDYQTSGDLPATVVNADFDRLWFALQEIYSGGKGTPTALRVPSGETINALPAAAARASYYLGFDGTGQPALLLPATGTAAALALDLASRASATKGGGLVGYDASLSYASGTVGAKMREFISVKDFGAVGDGVTDDSTAVQNALNASLHVFVPPGTYKIGTPLTLQSGQTVEGLGRPLLKASVNGKHVMGGTGLANVSLQGLRFQGNGSATVPTDSIGGFAATSTGLVTLPNCSDVRVNDCEAADFYNGFSAVNSDRVRIIGNRVRNWLVYGVLVSLATDFVVDYNVIVGCDQTGAVNAYGVSATGDETSGAASIQRAASISHNVIRDIPSWDGIMSHDVSGLRVIGNDIRNVRIGIDLGHVVATNFVRDLQVMGNLIESTATNTWGATPALHGGIVISGYDATHLVDGVQIIGNTVKGFFATVGMVTTGNPSHIVAAYCKRAAIVGNTVRDGGNVGSTAGVYVVGNNDGVTVVANQLQGTFTAGGVRLASVIADSVTVTGNTIKQGTTTDPAVSITGSTITSLVVDGNAHNSTTPLSITTSTVTRANTGSFTATLTGCTTSPTAAVAWAVSGNQVTLTLPSISATSNTTACTLTGLPAFLQPLVQSAICPVIGQDNAVFTNNLVAGITPGSGTITLQRAGSSTGWTSAGTKGLFGSTITYGLQ
jgi:hypothetical protein